MGVSVLCISRPSRLKVALYGLQSLSPSDTAGGGSRAAAGSSVLEAAGSLYKVRQRPTETENGASEASTRLVRLTFIFI